MQLVAACIQTNSTNDIDANIAAIAPMVREAATRGANFITLPENAFYMRERSDGAPQTYAADDHPGVLAAREWAKGLGVWIVVGSVAVRPEDENDARRYNRSLLISPGGKLAAQYDKIHLFDVEVGDGQNYQESKFVIPGAGMCVADVQGVKLGMTICYDVRFPHLYRSLAKAGAQVLTVPAAFTAVTGEAHWHVLLRARAIENGCYVVAAAQCGTHPGNRKTYGHSLIIDPWGRVLVDGGTEPGIILAPLPMAEVEAVRQKIPSLRHDREFTA